MNNGQMPLKTKSKIDFPYKKENDNVIVLVALMVVWVAFNSLIANYETWNLRINLVSNGHKIRKLQARNILQRPIVLKI